MSLSAPLGNFGFVGACMKVHWGLGQLAVTRARRSNMALVSIIQFRKLRLPALLAAIVIQIRGQLRQHSLYPLRRRF